MEYRAKKRKFTLAEQKLLGEKWRVKKVKDEEDRRDPNINKAIWNAN